MLYSCLHKVLHKCKCKCKYTEMLVIWQANRPPLKGVHYHAFFFVLVLLLSHAHCIYINKMIIHIFLLRQFGYLDLCSFRVLRVLSLRFRAFRGGLEPRLEMPATKSTIRDWNRSSLRNMRLEFETSGKRSISLEESMEYSPDRWRKNLEIKDDQNM